MQVEADFEVMGQASWTQKLALGEDSENLEHVFVGPDFGSGVEFLL
ncbi:MAG: hypothetical protein ABGY32_13785 [bacterium]